MKTIILFTLFLFIAGPELYAQIDVKEKAKDKTVQRADEKTDEVIDKSIDKIENGVKSVFKKKDKKGTNNQSQTSTEEEEQNDEPESTNENQSDENNVDDVQNNNSNTSNTVMNKKPNLEVYTKYDFIPGEKVIFYDDFSDVAVGEFPLLWNTNASGEVVSLNNYAGKWFRMKDDYSYYIPDCFVELPENYTIEFDAVFDDVANFSLEIYQRAEQSIISDYYPGVGGVYIGFENYRIEWKNWLEDLDNSIQSGDANHEQFEGQNSLQHYSIWVQKSRLRVYKNELKVLDVPRAVYTSLKQNQFRFGGYSSLLIGNFRIAVGLPDMRSRLLTEGRLVTNGILFDSGSDKIKGVSYGTLKDIANVLKENAGIKVKIVGHTDSDGDDKTNLDLSKRRALAVKNFLVKEFSIDAASLEFDGKGESEPVDKNNTTIGKANNRRVEFIKL